MRLFTCLDTREDEHFGKLFTLTDSSEKGLEALGQHVDLRKAIKRLE